MTKLQIENRLGGGFNVEGGEEEVTKLQLENRLGGFNIEGGEEEVTKLQIENRLGGGGTDEDSRLIPG